MTPDRRRSVKIAHISDLHFSFGAAATATNRHSVDYLKGIERLAAAEKPDHFVVTGDISDDADETSLARARDWLIGRITIAHNNSTGLNLGQIGNRIRRTTVTVGDADADPPPLSGKVVERYLASLSTFHKVFGYGNEIDWIPVSDGAVMLIKSDLSFLGDNSQHNRSIFSRIDRRRLLQKESKRLFGVYARGMKGQLQSGDGRKISAEQFKNALKLLVCHFPLLGGRTEVGVHQSTANRFALGNAMIGVRGIFCGHRHIHGFKDNLVCNLLKPREEARYSFNCLRRSIGIEELPPQFTLSKGRKMSRSCSAIIWILVKRFKSKRRSPLSSTSATEDIIQQVIDILVSSIDNPTELVRRVKQFLDTRDQESRSLFDEHEFLDIQDALQRGLTVEQRKQIEAMTKSATISKALNVFRRRRLIQRRCGSSAKFRVTNSPERCLLTHDISFDGTRYILGTRLFRWLNDEFALDGTIDEVVIHPA